MGISIEAKLIYGLPAQELTLELDEEQQEDLELKLDYGELDYASPFYDSPRNAWVVGVNIPCKLDFKGAADGLWEGEFQTNLIIARNEWDELFPEIEGRILLSPDVM